MEAITRTTSSGVVFSTIKSYEYPKVHNNIDDEWGRICALYREARHKSDEISILAQCYGVSPKDIAKLLHIHGYDDKCIFRYLCMN